MATNDFVPFCNDNTGTNLLSQSAYLSDPQLPTGNQPGIARSALVNKALRQGTTIASIFAQVVSLFQGQDMLDNQNSNDHTIPAANLGASIAAFKRHAPVISVYSSGSGNHNLTYKFQIASGNATAGATYSDGTTTYTVKTTIAAQTQVDASGPATPVALSGTLTKLTGTGDATLTFYSYRAALFLHVRMVGAGGGGGGGGTAGGGNGGDGSDTTFGTSLLNAGHGSGGASRAGGGGAPGGGSLGTGPTGFSLAGGAGGCPGASNTAAAFGQGGNGGSSAFGGAAQGGVGSSGGTASVNTGGGGAGGGGPGAANSDGGVGGGSGGYVDAYINAPLSQYAYSVGAAGGPGSAGTSGFVGGTGSAGLIIVEEHYQ